MGISRIYIVWYELNLFVGYYSFEDFVFLGGGNSSCSVPLRGYGNHYYIHLLSLAEIVCILVGNGTAA